MIKQLHLATYSTVLLLLALSLSCTIAHAQISPTRRSTPTEANEAGGTLGGDTGAARDKLFLHKAAEYDLAAIQLSQLALQKSSNGDLKNLAQAAIDDDTALQSKVEQLATNLGAEPAKKLSKNDEKDLAKLNVLSGADFDKAYLALFKKDSQKALTDFKQEISYGSNPGAKQFSDQGAKTIQKTLDHLTEIAQ